MEEELEHLALYNRPEFCALNIREPLRYYRIDYAEGTRLVGSLAGVVDGERFVSGFSAGFGGPEFIRESERLEGVMAFVAHCLCVLADNRIRDVEIRAKPLHYSSNEPFIQFALLRHGFEQIAFNLNFTIDVSRLRSADDYLASLGQKARQQLRRAIAASYRWRPAHGLADWHDGYGVLEASRRRHAATLSLSLAYILELRERFPDRVLMFLLEDERCVVAAALVYVIRTRAAQVMFWGDSQRRDTVTAPRGEAVAVMKLVAYRLVEEALRAGWHSLDLGPSTSVDSINYGNCTFKTAVGARAGFRSSFVRRLARP